MWQRNEGRHREKNIKMETDHCETTGGISFYVLVQPYLLFTEEASDIFLSFIWSRQVGVHLRWYIYCQSIILYL